MPLRFFKYMNHRFKPLAYQSQIALKKCLLISIVALLLLQLAPSVLVQAQSPIQVLSTSARADYPQSITFKIQAQSSANITKLALRYKLDREACVSSITSEAWPEFVPATKLDTSWVWQMKKTGGLPPGASVEYSWLVEDARGNRFETRPATLSFDDTRYSWKNIKDGIITIYWYDGDQNFAKRLLSAAQKALQRMDKDTGIKLERPVRIFIYDSTEALQSARVFSPQWEGGVAFTDYSIVAIGINQSSIAWGETTIAHELTHVLTYKMTRSCYGRVPTWLSEGLSTYAEGDLETNQQKRLQRAITDNNLFSVRTLSGPFPAQTEQALLSYAESYSLVKFLIGEYGSNKMLTLLAAFKEGLEPDEALNKAYGLDTDKLDTMWRASIGAPPRPVSTPVAPTATPKPSITTIPSPMALTPSPTLTPTLSPAVTSQTPTQAPARTPTGRSGFLSCQSASANSSIPAHIPDYGNGLTAFGVVVFGLSLFGWIKRGRR